MNLKLTRLLLVSEGYLVRTAEQAEGALEALQSFHPRLILMDVQLPGMDGLELTRRLRADHSLDDVVILAVTAYAMKSDEQRALAAGCDGYVSKPIDTRTLPALIQDYLRGRKKSRSAGPPPP